MEAEVTIDPLPEHHTPFDIFSAVTDIENLIKLIVVKSNLCAQQKGREFQTNEQEMRAVLGNNYVMTINKLLAIKRYWECGQYVGNEGIRNVMSRSRFEEILQNCSNNTKDDKSDKGYKVRSLINHFNQSFSECVSGDCTQSIDEHMVKFTGRSCMKQYVKNKTIKWGFKFWFRCASPTGYLYQLDLYLGKKEKNRRKSWSKCCFKND